jgi:hypothetical protein
VARWLRLLSSELVQRMVEDRQAHNRQPKTLVLHSRGALRQAREHA